MNFKQKINKNYNFPKSLHYFIKKLQKSLKLPTTLNRKKIKENHDKKKTFFKNNFNKNPSKLIKQDIKRRKAGRIHSREISVESITTNYQISTTNVYEM